jgi:hypothetical protein
MSREEFTIKSVLVLKQNFKSCYSGLLGLEVGGVLNILKLLGTASEIIIALIAKGSAVMSNQ